MKVCNGCDLLLELSEFHCCKQAKDGRQNKCKVCQREYANVNRERKREIIRAYRLRNLDLCREREKVWVRQWRKDNPTESSAAVATYRKNNPEQRQAHRAVEKALKQGILTKPLKCEWCDLVRKLDATHGDYAKPLEIIWLCRPCHAIRDKRTYAARQAEKEGGEEPNVDHVAKCHHRRPVPVPP